MHTFCFLKFELCESIDERFFFSQVVSQVDVAGLIPNKKELETDIAKVIKELEIVRKGEVDVKGKH